MLPMENMMEVSMHATSPASLDSAALSRRLSELAGHERDIQVEFLLHLSEYDRRRAYLEEGYESLWAYCQRALLLREGPAALRITAMRALRRFPALAVLLHCRNRFSRQSRPGSRKHLCPRRGRASAALVEMC